MLEPNLSEEDKSLLALFGYLPLQECIRLRIICHQWNKLIAYKLQQVESLKLFESFEHVEKYCEMLLSRNQTDDNDLALKPAGEGNDDIVLGGYLSDYPHFVASCLPKRHPFTDRAASRFLVRLLPNVQRLVIFYDMKSKIDIHFLLQHYGPHLTSLTIGQFSDDVFLSPFSDHTILVPLMRNMPQLRVLNHAINGGIVSDHQLERLSMQRFDHHYLESLRQVSSNLKELIIDEFRTYDFDVVQQVVQENQHLGANLEKLVIGELINDEMGLTPYETIFANFTQLKSLMINFEFQNTDLAWITSQIKLLSKLEDLFIVLEASWFDLEDSHLINLTQLDSVRTLSLKLLDHTQCTVERFAATLRYMFPLVTKIVIEFITADSVDFTSTDDFARFVEQNPQLNITLRGPYRQFDYLPLMGRHREYYQKEWLAVDVIENYESLEDTSGDEQPDNDDQSDGTDDYTDSDSTDDEYCEEGEEESLSDQEENMDVDYGGQMEQTFLGVPLLFLATVAADDQSEHFLCLSQSVAAKDKEASFGAFRSLLKRHTLRHLPEWHFQIMLDQLQNEIDTVARTKHISHLLVLIECFTLAIQTMLPHFPRCIQKCFAFNYFNLSNNSITWLLNLLTCESLQNETVVLEALRNALDTIYDSLPFASLSEVSTIFGNPNISIHEEYVQFLARCLPKTKLDTDILHLMNCVKEMFLSSLSYPQYSTNGVKRSMTELMKFSELLYDKCPGPVSLYLINEMKQKFETLSDS